MSWLLLGAGWVCSLGLVVRLAGLREAAARTAHELRGPLTAAMLALHGIEGPPERVAALSAQLERAARAVDDLAGEPDDRPEPLAVAAVVAGVAEAWRPVAAAHGRGLCVTPAPAGLYVLGDRVRLAQAVGNLVANALEHGDGTVHVRPRVRGGCVRIEVLDEGAGLDRPLPALVRRRRAGRGERGRGLAIAAGIATRHGGRLTLAPGRPGARLVLELPLVAPLEIAPAVRP